VCFRHPAIIVSISDEGRRRSGDYIHPVSVLATGFHGIPDDHEVFLSLPARLGRAGVLGVADMELTEEETRRLRRSAKTLWENTQLLGL
jgi:L-lactate dehydrogenase